MIITGHLALAADPAGHPTGATPQNRLVLSPGGVRVEGGRIAEVFDLQKGPAPDLGGHGCVIFPGFIDAHLHLPQFDSVGVHGMTLLDWLDRVIFPAEVRWRDADFAGAMATRVARELLSFGTTGVCAYATVHEPATRSATAALAQAGLRGLLGQVLMDRNAPSELIRPAAQLLAEAAHAKIIGRIDPIVTPRFAVSCTEELLKGAGELASARGLRIQTHLAELKAECDLVQRLFGGLSYTEVYRRTGVLQAGAIMAHGVHLGPQARHDLAAAGAVVAHCPTANLFLQSGTMDRAGLHRAGVATVLGSDIAGGHERSMVRVAQAMIETAAARAMTLGIEDPMLPTAAEAWWQITAGNAGVLGWNDGGRLAPGCSADVVVVRPTIAWMESHDPLGALLWAWDDRWISNVIVNGAIAS